MRALAWFGKRNICGRADGEAAAMAPLKALVIGASLLALAVPPAYAQTGDQMASPEALGGGHYVVTFALDGVSLSPQDRQVIAQAAADYRAGGAPQITVTGYTDTSGPAEYNLVLSQQRAETVADALVEEGVPATSIVTIGRGEEDLLVPTADGVREPRNRRVEIVVPPPPAPAPVVAAPAPVEQEPMEEEPARRNVFTIGPIYGHNFGETDDGGENDLVGGQLTYSFLPGFLGGMSLKQAILYSFNGEDDGANGRSIISLDFAPDLGIIRPILAANFGGVYGPGVQNGLVAGPEIGFNLDVLEGVDLRATAAYDYQFRNSDFDEGILWGGLGMGFSF
ncbi:MAG TPA: OmpA family protein [Geminicoccaceae bacterium]|nr:OmpA family protein [Geminicoccaceae bacterium]